MNKQFFNSRFWFVASLIFTVAIFRLVPHWPNFTPVAAMALFGGAIFGKKYLAFIIPLAAMLISDMIIGFHASMWAVYLSFAITVVLGIVISRKPGWISIAVASVSSTILFFLITNFASWIASPFYPQNMTGLTQCYAAGLAFLNDGKYGISFFMNSLLGDLFYNGMLFGAFYLVKMRFPVIAKA